VCAVTLYCTKYGHNVIVTDVIYIEDKLTLNDTQWTNSVTGILNNWRFLSYRTATQYDRLLVSSCRPSVCLSLCNAVHCGSQGRCTALKVVPACS